MGSSQIMSRLEREDNTVMTESRAFWQDLVLVDHDDKDRENEIHGVDAALAGSYSPRLATHFS